MSTQTETTIYQSGIVTVTTARFIVGRQTYAIRNITSVRHDVISPNQAGPFVVIVFGVICLVAGFSGEPSTAAKVFGALLIASAIIAISLSKELHTVVLATSGGEAKAIESKEEATITRIVAALNDAIIDRA